MLPSSEKHIYGHLPDPEGHRRTSVRHLVGAGTFPTSASLEAFLPSVKDQGSTGRCVGFGKAGAIFTTGKGKLFLPSPTGIYRLARAVDREPNADGSLPALIDEGSQPNQADRAIAEWGVSPWDDALDGPDISPDELNREPILVELEGDDDTKLIGSYMVDELAPDFEAQFCRAIAGGYAVSFAIPDCDDGFESYSGGALGGPSGRQYGGHEIFAYGYSLSPAGELTIYGQNSWSTTWGLNGRFAANRAFMDRMVDVQAMSVRKAAS